VAGVLDDGLRTADLGSGDGIERVGTAAMARAIAGRIAAGVAA
jgi:hypothetical protein